LSASVIGSEVSSSDQSAASARKNDVVEKQTAEMELKQALDENAKNVIAKTHHIAIQVDQNDPLVMNLALNNATNIFE
jgi:hypothetical protein